MVVVVHLVKALHQNNELLKYYHLIYVLILLLIEFWLEAIKTQQCNNKNRQHWILLIVHDLHRFNHKIQHKRKRNKQVTKGSCEVRFTCDRVLRIPIWASSNNLVKAVVEKGHAEFAMTCPRAHVRGRDVKMKLSKNVWREARFFGWVVRCDFFSDKCCSIDHCWL